MNEKGRFYQKLRFHVRIFFLAACLPFYNEWADGLKGAIFIFIKLGKIYLYPHPISRERGTAC
jgi:ABC-type uncharacterized transport system permease subunit